MPETVYRPYYGVFANPILWFLQHGLWQRLQCADIEGVVLRAWQEGYVPANQLFAEAVVDELDRCQGTPWVMLHDYHLYVTGLFVRHLRSDAVLQHVIHIPWPEPEAWQHLPREIVESILAGLLANDSLVFQTDAFAARFLLTCQAWLSRAHVDEDRRIVTYDGHETRVWANPVSVDPLGLRTCLSLPEARRYRERLASLVGERTIVRVDRLDPSKHVAAGFRAFRRLLERWPEWRGRVRFLAFLVPSRTTVPEYQAYAAEVFREIEAINTQFGGPVTVFYEQNRLQALAGLTLYDVLLVNPVADGLNLVSKEGPVVNERDGVLVLSETAGAFAELGDAALPVRADDIEGTAEALDAALRMSQEERRERARALRETIARHDVARWMRLLVDDLARRSTLRLPLETSAPLGSAP
jgi:trehalose 6-phosphate synthase